MILYVVVHILFLHSLFYQLRRKQIMLQKRTLMMGERMQDSTTIMSLLLIYTEKGTTTLRLSTNLKTLILSLERVVVISTLNDQEMSVIIQHFDKYQKLKSTNRLYILLILWKKSYQVLDAYDYEKITVGMY